MLFVFGQWTDIYGFSHAQEYTTFPNTSRETALGLAYALTGRLADALPLLEQAVEQEAIMGGGNGAVFLTRLSHGYLLAGRLEEVRTHAERALVLAG